MSAYKDALHISVKEAGQRLQLAIDLLLSGEGVVVIDNLLALRPHKGQILCEVISQGTTPPQDQIKNAKAFLQESSISEYLPCNKLQWLVVEDYGTGTIEVWCES
jgi:hypothetical protein